jgi:hypothetical protein
MQIGEFHNLCPPQDVSIGGECRMHVEDDMFLKHVILKVECDGIILK